MSLKSYIEEKFMQNESTGGVLLDALSHGAIEKINDLDPSSGPTSPEELLGEIGIKDDDDMEAIKSKLNFALSSPDSVYIGRHGKDFLCMDKKYLEDLREAGAIRGPGDPINLKLMRSEKEILKKLGQKPSSVPSIEEFKERAIREEIKQRRKFFRIILEWLDN